MTRMGGTRGIARIAVYGLLAAFAGPPTAGCSGLPDPPANAPPPAGAQSAGAVTIHVASNGWHTMVVLPRGALPPGMIPEAADFPEAEWLGFGWGDAAYFPEADPGLGTTLRAALLPTDAVILMSGLPRPVRAVHPEAKIVTLAVSKDGLRRMAGYIDATFDRGGGARARPVAPGEEPFSRFYPAAGTFHIFNTCNTWTARALETAGLPVQVAGTITADALMTQVRELETRAGAQPAASFLPL